MLHHVYSTAPQQQPVVLHHVASQPPASTDVRASLDSLGSPARHVVHHVETSPGPVTGLAADRFAPAPTQAGNRTCDSAELINLQTRLAALERHNTGSRDGASSTTRPPALPLFDPQEDMGIGAVGGGLDTAIQVSMAFWVF